MKKQIFAAFVFVSSVTIAQPVELVVYSATGNQSDTAARYFAPLIEDALKQKVVVVNKPGANGVIGIRYAAETAEKKDVILVGNAAIGLASVTKKLPFDPQKQFVPVHGMSYGHAAIYVSSKSSIKTAQDILETYKRNGRVLVGSTSDLDDVTLLQLGQVLKIPVELVRYKNATQMAIELAENSIDLTIGTVGASAYQAFADQGLLKAVAVIDATRSPYMPNVPTLTEKGFAKVEGFRWTAFFVSAEMPQDRLSAIADAIRVAMRSKGAVNYELLPGLPQRFLRSADEITAIQQHEAVVIAAQIKAGSNL